MENGSFSPSLSYEVPLPSYSGYRVEAELYPTLTHQPIKNSEHPNWKAMSQQAEIII